MKLAPREASGYFARPDPERAGLLIYGDDPMQIVLRRQEVIRALIGPKGDEEMRLTRLQGAALRSDPAQALDAIKAASFFPGPRAVLIEDATDAAAPMVLAALDAWAPGDAALIVTAGALKRSSRLRKGFEDHRSAYSAAIYSDPPTRSEIEQSLRAAGLTPPEGSVMAALYDLAREMGAGNFHMVLEKIALYKLNDPTPLSGEDIAACAPLSTEAELDDILHVVAEARPAEIAPVLRKLQSQGATPVGVMIAATRHFRMLHAAAAHPRGPDAGLAQQRPPVFGPRKDRMARQAQTWGAARLETALGFLTDTDLALRAAGQTAPQMALVERVLIRIAMVAAR